MNKKDIIKLNKDLDKIIVRAIDKEGYSLIHYADVAVMINKRKII